MALRKARTAVEIACASVLRESEERSWYAAWCPTLGTLACEFDTEIDFLHRLPMVLTCAARPLRLEKRCSNVHFSARRAGDALQDTAEKAGDKVEQLGDKIQSKTN